MRLLQFDASYIPLSDIYDFHCQSIGISKEDPILYAGEKVKKVLRQFRQPASRQVRSDAFSSGHL